MKYFQPLLENQGFLIFQIRTEDDPRLLLERLRKGYPDAIIQFVRPSAVSGKGRLAWSIRQNWAAAKRGILAAKKQEVDLLMRMTQTDQISQAIKVAGISSSQRRAVAIVIGPRLTLERLETNLGGQQITNYIASPRNPPSLEGDLSQEKQDLLLLEKSAVLLALKHRHFSDNLKNP